MSTPPRVMRGWTSDAGAGQRPARTPGRLSLQLFITVTAALFVASCSRSVRPSLTVEAPDQTSGLRALRTTWGLASVSWAIACRGEMVDAGAIGNAAADRAADLESRYRMASLAKWVVAAGAHRLAEEGRLDLDAPIVPILGWGPEDVRDARMMRITSRMLLEHSAGFDRERSFDPMFADAKIVLMSPEAGPGPADLDRIVRVMRTLELDFDPGTGFAYSNFGYSLLGEVMERVSGEPLSDWLRRGILEPAGARAMAPARTRPRDRPSDEVDYFVDPAEGVALSVFDGREVSPADGGFYIEAMLAHGGLIGTPRDYVRFLATVDGHATPADSLSPASLRAMLSSPRHRAFEGEPAWYAHGVNVAERPGDDHRWHSGAKPGSSAWAELAEDGTAAVVLVNSRPADPAYWDALRVALGEQVELSRSELRATGCEGPPWGPHPEIRGKP